MDVLQDNSEVNDYDLEQYKNLKVNAFIEYFRKGSKNIMNFWIELTPNPKAYFPPIKS